MKKMFLISSVFFALLLMFACNEEEALQKIRLDIGVILIIGIGCLI